MRKKYIKGKGEQPRMNRRDKERETENNRKNRVLRESRRKEGYIHQKGAKKAEAGLVEWGETKGRFIGQEENGELAGGRGEDT